MKEVFIYSIATISFTTILGYSIHMFVGGLVSSDTERYLIIGGCVIGLGVIAILASNVIKARRQER